MSHNSVFSIVFIKICILITVVFRDKLFVVWTTIFKFK